MRRVLRRPAFRRVFAAQTVSRWGDTFNSVALVILVYELTGSGLKVAGTVIFEIVPVVALGFVAGRVVDRYPRRHVMLIADLARAGVAMLLVFDHQHLPVIYLAAFLLSALSVFFNPAAASMLPSLVPADEIVSANSAIWSAAVISQIALAPVAGVIVALAGPGPAFAVNAASFLVSAAFVAQLPVTSPARRASTKRFGDITEGLALIRDSRFLTVLAGVQGLAALATGATSAMLVVLAKEHLNISSSRFGLLIAAIGVGAGFGPLVLQRLAQDVNRPAFLYGPYVLRGGVDLALATSTNFAVALGALSVYGIGTSTGNVTYNSILQTNVPNELRGRVFAFYDVVWQSARLASIGIGGVLADRYGITTVYWTGGLLLLAAGTLGLTTGRNLSIPTSPDLTHPQP